MDSPFEILGIEPDADDAEVDRAFRRRVIEVHPDQGGSAAEFNRVRSAYEMIKEGHPIEAVNGEVSGDTPSSSSSASVPDDGDEDEDELRSKIEYLNYEVLDDHGWDLGDDDLFEKAAAANLPHEDYGQFLVQENETLLEAAENRGYAWPYACRGGACANCAVAVFEGEMDTPGDHILPSTMLDSDIRLSCMGAPLTDDMKVVFNVKHLPGLDELRLPPYPFEQAHMND
ncbi:ferredoxin [Halogeometricum borinquense DSM 11551]|uniref:Ferredoxin n=1 Tax=Halogeometricum borinquense (strain ATCC 700274 / DSM 11551 / JCM 10706 / KCTC 4070 / PR3) TaxID=469382 RepID=E4NMH5_HALBP|nr:ferredoxin Fer [Halogeometricum borinquense]ADQ68473.1 ferredoxin [Halogeometricum borinquense DSM 11551]ELY27883.1 ferredoxin [Halogeometricum borinquense DSM 11551]